ncbi:restriction endonuclease subunit S [Vibrio parahaemolyticus]|nr:restriction endonuclease subunit S [Vibrio parahaemolyticus]
MSSSMIPTSWIETTLGSVVDYGATIKVEAVSIENDAWILELEDIDKNSSKLNKRATFSDRKSKSTKNKFSEGDVLYGKLRPYLNKTLLADKDGYCSTEIIPIKTSKHIHNRYLHYSMKRKKFLDYVESASHGMSMPRLGTKQGQAAPFVLAPLNEQIRIANKLDSILAKVDKAQARLDKIPAILKRFRQSVLAAATSGELTKEWRESKDLHWEVTSFGKLIKNGPQNGIYKPSKLYGSGTKIIRIDGFYDGKLSPWESIKSVQLENDELAKWKLKVDDILINRVNSIEYLGKCGHVDCLPEDAVFESNIMRVELDKSLANPLFIKHFLSSPIGLMRLRANAKHAVNQASINQTDVKSVEIQLPSIEEQKLIAELVEAFLDKANKVEKQYLEAKSRLDRLTQSILAKAFRGELVPQDPNDEPAEKLLERILAEKEQSKPKKTTRKRTTKAKTAEKE